jgi:adenylate cyclase
MPGTSADATAPLRSWLTDAGLANMSMAELLDGFCGRLVAAGFPLTRAYLSTATLHPQLWATGATWLRGSLLEPTVIGYGFERESSWVTSPFRHMLDAGLPRLHRRLVGDAARLDFPVLEEFRAEGLTDWLAVFHLFGWKLAHQEVDQLGVIISFATDRPEGWSAEELARIEDLSRPLALAAKASGSFATVRSLLATYLGHDAAERVIAGQVRRGSVERISAFVLYADLRGFTAFAQDAPPEEVIRRLNAYFDCMGEPVKAAGGHILKFLGDGLLAVFAPGDDRAGAAEAALSAAQSILGKIATLNEEERAAGRPPLDADIALHEGEVTYGNVGTADRLDFTVIGPAVNEASRLETLCQALGSPLLVSDSFLRAAPSMRARLRSLGEHRLRGVREPREVFAPIPNDAR